MKKRWVESWQRRSFRIVFIVTIIELFVLLLLWTKFLQFAEARQGKVLGDVLMDLYVPGDVSNITFFVTYLSGFIGLGYLISQPGIIIKSIQTYIVLVLLRMLTMFLLPLEPPAHIIPLNDPILHTFFYGGKDNLKDLFFSGHTATIFMFYLLYEPKILKGYFLISTLVVAVLVVFQHVHYTIDVLAAPVFAWVAYKLAGGFYQVIKKIVLPAGSISE